MFPAHAENGSYDTNAPDTSDKALMVVDLSTSFLEMTFFIKSYLMKCTPAVKPFPKLHPHDAARRDVPKAHMWPLHHCGSAAYKQDIFMGIGNFR